MDFTAGENNAYICKNTLIAVSERRVSKPDSLIFGVTKSRQVSASFIMPPSGLWSIFMFMLSIRQQLRNPPPIGGGLS